MKGTSMSRPGYREDGDMEEIFEEPINVSADTGSTEDAPVMGAEERSSPAESAERRVSPPLRAECRRSPGEGARVIATPEDDSSEWEALENAISYEVRHVFPTEEEEHLKTWVHVGEILIQGLDSGAVPGKEYATSKDDIEAMTCILSKGISHASIRSARAVKWSSGLSPDINNNEDVETCGDPDRETVWAEDDRWIPPCNARYRRLLRYHRWLTEERGYPPSELMVLLNRG